MIEPPCECWVLSIQFGFSEKAATCSQLLRHRSSLNTIFKKVQYWKKCQFSPQRILELQCKSQHILVILKIYFIWMNVLPSCTYVNHMHAWCPKRPEEDTKSSGTWVRRWLWVTMWVLGSFTCECWGPLQVDLTSEPCLQLYTDSHTHTPLSLSPT